MEPTVQKRDMNAYAKALGRLVRAGAKDNLRKVVLKAHPSDLARVIEKMSSYERRDLLKVIYDCHKLGLTILELVENIRFEILSDLESEKIGTIVCEVSSDDAADILGVLSNERLDEVFAFIKDLQIRRKLRHLLSFGSETAGGIMQTEFLSMPGVEKVKNAVAFIRNRHKDSAFFYLYTIDEENRLSGVISLRQLLLADENSSLEDICNSQVVKVTVDEDQEKVAALVYKYDLLAIPVVDSKNRLVGIITVDDVMDVMEEEVSDDIYKLAGSNVEEMLYGDHILKISRVRLPWLLIAIMTELVAAMIIGFFSNTLSQVIILASFIPVLNGMAGNVATQSAAITVRGIALGRLDLKSLYHTVFREMRVGFTLGLICGAIVTVISYFYAGNVFLGLVVGSSMFLCITFAATNASAMPLFFSRFGIDPAIASGPLVTTINDAATVTIYLSLATFMLKYIA